jgi:protein transport protein SEC20
LPLKGLYWILGTTAGFATRSTKQGISASLQGITITTSRSMATPQPAAGDQPTFAMEQGMSIQVGGGGRGRSGPGGHPSPAPQESRRSVTEDVERIIDESQEQNQQGIQEAERDNSTGEKREDEVAAEEERPKPNPKKRMWEEDKEAKKEEERKRDEL